MPRIRVNDINIYYELMGEGFPLVMIMGLTANTNWWRPDILDSLAGKYRLLIFDNRGAGKTDAPDTEQSISMYAKDTVDLMTGLGIERANIFGISMGGLIAQEIAISYPHRVEKLVLGCTHCGGKQSVPITPEVMSILSGPKISLEDSLRINFTDDYMTGKPNEVNDFKKRYLISLITPKAYIRQFQACREFDSYDRLSRITAPTLILTGNQDKLVPPRNSEILAGRIKGSRLVTFNGCGHLFFEQDHRVADLLKEFLG